MPLRRRLPDLCRPPLTVKTTAATPPDRLTRTSDPGAPGTSRRARVWISPERARWVREERPVVAELADGAIIVEFPFKGIDWLVREILKEAGDAAVIEPVEARDAVRDAAAKLAGAYSRT